MKAAIVTVSDKGSQGLREDVSGPALKEFLENQGVEICQMDIVPDELDEIFNVLKDLAVMGGVDLILTTGGTGVSPRDVTPDATQRVVDRELPGFAERMRFESLRKTPHAIISRAVVGIKGETLIINLPGSPKGALENLESVWLAVPHAVRKIKGDLSDCAQ